MLCACIGVGAHGYRLGEILRAGRMARVVVVVVVLEAERAVGAGCTVSLSW